MGQTLHADFGATDGVPRDYFVPNFGVDEDINATHRNIRAAQTKLKHNLTADFGATDGVPRDYFVPNFGVDHDIITTQRNIALEEAIHGDWNPI